MTTPPPTSKEYFRVPMEGVVATWYAQQTRNLNADFAAEARGIAERMGPGARLLEIAPGPGYLAVEIAKLGPFEVVGLDLSRSFVRMATDYAAQSGVAVKFLQGDASSMPFAADQFDAIVCRAAFKNFTDPVGAIAEMHRVLHSGGSALIRDMRRDASNSALDSAVSQMRLGPITSLVNRIIFRKLRKRAYSKDDFERLVAATPFACAEISQTGIGFDAWLRKA